MARVMVIRNVLCRVVMLHLGQLVAQLRAAHAEANPMPDAEHMLSVAEAAAVAASEDGRSSNSGIVVDSADGGQAAAELAAAQQVIAAGRLSAEAEAEIQAAQIAQSAEIEAELKAAHLQHAPELSKRSYKL